MRYTASRYADLTVWIWFQSYSRCAVRHVLLWNSKLLLYVFLMILHSLSNWSCTVFKLHWFVSVSQKPCNSRTYCRNITEIKPDCDVLLTNAIKLLILLSHMSILFSLYRGYLTYAISTNAVPTYTILRLFSHKWRNWR